jgi:hypothetical protein
MVLKICPDVLGGFLLPLVSYLQKNMDDGILLACFATELKQCSVVPEDKASPSKVNIFQANMTDDSER